ncbi:MAG: sugar kinase [Candidatus Muproteobacteria bacterium RIFCSPHIGHO2_12_FULL_60_33]|uniref:Sugar kinase n=1 Tax=Candidatus Muproteobacteria bacterium RIFCSPLOWO2_01_FULL_60_18 TaxID=1817768 RepID=A0A1F6TZ32_9PROT|nr:MAG: sugar kinase [Candidatus Muproteobacteria bacterium RIFCSPLOWO2_01_FULL_60_18]OGI50720.1 MAG: sugar kinase [Candidatus Muproteobacteria bacterium RIFCSPHIGHO2_01_60_12]OGI56255.1 MAG: sugar kinase [Candidatus Muproteobacteria bacterium RIFCSPHIGHO2_12_FULL_60_33]OGI56651.1 MAG: sugar kinase [Candidatus Muproteobacteria bacterium RIFCSPHIGHO2_02_FULL_60_13]
MSALICGSFAYDTIMVFPDRFKNHILPDKVHILNVSFQVPEMRREFGGCAGNIAYNLKLLGGEPLPMGTVGKDFGPYAEWMDRHRINRRHIKVCEDTYTAQAFITTDMDDNQITAFHPGAMNRSQETRVGDAQGVKLGIVAPDGREGMLNHARQFAEAGIPFIFDPGQGMPLFNGDDLLRFLEQAAWVTLNDYEAELIQERTEKSLSQLAGYVQGIIVTLGARGSCVYTDGQVIEIPVVPAAAVNDPTGCGDAYRAGLLYGLLNHMDWETTGRIAALIGSIKIEHHGTQNHHFTRDRFFSRFKETFGYSL